MRAVLGNRKAIVRTVDDDGQEHYQDGPKGKQATVIDFPEGTPLGEALQVVTNAQGVWAYHAAEGAKPAWVASDSPGLAAVLSEHFGGVEVRDLLDPYDPANRGTGGGGGAGEGATGGISTFLPLLGLLLWVSFVLSKFQTFLKTNAGNDFQAAQMAGAASATAVAKWVALTANSTTPAAGDTTLTGEITTGGGGLIRKAGTYAHTTSAASYTLTTVFTANGSDSLPVTIAKRGVFDAASSGNLVFTTLLSSTATLSASGDQLTITDTVTL